MTTKHTLGPWRYERDGNKQEWLISGGRCEALGYSSWIGLAVVMGSDDDKANGIIAATANARLIAAAPDLLEALVKARQELANLPSSYGYQFTHIADMDSAIAKATGADK